jgi:hypothetical protein
MAHFAELDENNIVINVIVVNNSDMLDENGNENEQIGISFLKNVFGQDKIYVQTSYNNNFRVKYASIGDQYSQTYDAFITPPLYPSWIFNQQTLFWEPPLPYPGDDENFYIWDEQALTWVRE